MLVHFLIHCFLETQLVGYSTEAQIVERNDFRQHIVLWTFFPLKNVLYIVDVSIQTRMTDGRIRMSPNDATTTTGTRTRHDRGSLRFFSFTILYNMVITYQLIIFIVKVGQADNEMDNVP
jgi:hypothetical protein